METKKTLGVIGSVMLFIGVFMPVISIPIAGDINYFQNGKGDGVIVLVLAAISFYEALAEKYRGLMVTGLASILVMAITFAVFTSRMAEAKEKMGADLADNPFKGLADAAFQSIQFQWGWGVMIAGAALVIAAGAIKK